MLRTLSASVQRSDVAHVVAGVRIATCLMREEPRHLQDEPADEGERDVHRGGVILGPPPDVKGGSADGKVPDEVGSKVGWLTQR